VPCSNIANIEERKTWMQSEFCTRKHSVRELQPPKMCTGPGDGQRSSKVWLDSGERCWCSNAVMMRNPLKLAGVPQTPEPNAAVSGPKFAILWGHLEKVFLPNKFLFYCRHMPQLRRYSPTKLCNGAQTTIFCVIFSESCAAHFRPAF